MRVTSVPKRTGFSLIEMTVAITMGSTLMLLGVGLIHKTMEARRAAVEMIERENTLSRMAAWFRRDVRTAAELQMRENGLQIATDRGEVVRYEVREGSLSRINKQDGDEWREAVDLAGLQCEFEAIDNPRRISLLISSPIGSAMPRVLVQSIAIQGRWAGVRSAGVLQLPDGAASVTGNSAPDDASAVSPSDTGDSR